VVRPGIFQPLRGPVGWDGRGFGSVLHPIFRQSGFEQDMVSLLAVVQAYNRARGRRGQAAAFDTWS
jgi:hypothetical protein